MNMKAVGWGLSTAAIAGLALCLPNALWLRHSTIKITNQGASTVLRATMQAENETVEYQAIEPGESMFKRLPNQTRGSVALTLPPGQQLDSFCHTYVEATMYHVDVTVADGRVVACDASLPIVSNLWVLQALL